MAKIEHKTKENPKLQQSTLSDGRISLYLEYYLGRSQQYDIDAERIKVKHNRRKESLHLYLIDKPRTNIERFSNKETLRLAQEIRTEREQLLKLDKSGKRIFQNKEINFLDYFQTYIDNYKKKDIRMMELALRRFREFLKIDYPSYSNFLKSGQINKEMITEFVEYLEHKSRGEGAKSAFQRFKKVINYACEKDIIRKNPCTGIKCTIDENALVKDILSLEEMGMLISTKYEGQNPNVRRAFILCLYTGIRFCDVVTLKYKNVDYSNRLLTFEQLKTKGKSSSSTVTIPLNEGLLTLIGKPVSSEANDEIIFSLPSHTMCLKALKRWTNRAGINKHITWHCARHSFAVNILNNGANIKTVASLLGHAGLRHTEKYTRAVDSLKEAAINSLPQLIY